MGKKQSWTYTSRVWLDIDAPFSRVEVEGCQRPLLAKDFELVDPLVATVVASVGETLGILVGEDGTVGLHGRPARQVLQQCR